MDNDITADRDRRDLTDEHAASGSGHELKRVQDVGVDVGIVLATASEDEIGVSESRRRDVLEQDG
jgi:hypothetical protein